MGEARVTETEVEILEFIAGPAGTAMAVLLGAVFALVVRELLKGDFDEG